MSEISKKLVQKKEALTKHLNELGQLAIAFSGGVDSAYLLKMASLCLPEDRVLALTVNSAIFPAWEAQDALDLAKTLAAPHLMLEYDVLNVPGLADNPPDRCYLCKKSLFQTLIQCATERGFSHLADGANTDDDLDYRPGTRATQELGIISPLKAAGLSKKDIRLLSAELDLPTWNKPAYACLASRFPYGQQLNPEKLRRVEKAEDYLRSLGFRELRVRHHEDLARLEVAPAERSRFFDLNLMDQIDAHLKSLGFTFVSLDLGGYQQGSLNQVLTSEKN